MAISGNTAHPAISQATILGSFMSVSSQLFFPRCSNRLVCRLYHHYVVSSRESIDERDWLGHSGPPARFPILYTPTVPLITCGFQASEAYTNLDEDMPTPSIVGQFSVSSNLWLKPRRLRVKVLTCANDGSQKRVVAQLGSALDWGSRGRWFESSPPDQRTRGRTGCFPVRPFSFLWPIPASTCKRFHEPAGYPPMTRLCIASAARSKLSWRGLR